jgi:hypothetical protein
VENEMLRLASFFAIACLSLAATALLTTPKKLAEEQPQSDPTNKEASKRFAEWSPEGAVSFHARFSLN